MPSEEATGPRNGPKECYQLFMHVPVRNMKAQIVGIWGPGIFGLVDHVLAGIAELVHKVCTSSLRLGISATGNLPVNLLRLRTGLLYRYRRKPAKHSVVVSLQLSDKLSRKGVTH